VIVELRDVYLTVERTLIDRGQANMVGQTRLTFQQAMFGEFLAVVEELTDRKVSSYVSESITSPEAVLEIFYLEPGGDVAGRLEREAREDAGEVSRPRGGLRVEETTSVWPGASHTFWNARSCSGGSPVLAGSWT